MNQGPRYVRLIEKSLGRKSHATVPLICVQNLNTAAPATFMTQVEQ